MRSATIAWLLALSTFAGYAFGAGVPAFLVPQMPAQPVRVGFPLISTILTVEDASHNPLSGISVTYSSPSNGPSCTFSNGAHSITVVSASDGTVGPGATANSLAGPYNVTASTLTGATLITGT